MKIYPAIDIKEGNCVRLSQGDYDKETIYSDNPIDIALNWEKQGGEFIHVVDLDGAKTGESSNHSLIIQIASKLSVPIQVGGGIRSIEVIERLLSAGINRVILGTLAIKQPEFVKKAVDAYKDRIVVGVDAKDGKVAVDGWLSVSEIKAVELAKKVEDMGVRTIIYTDISKDGMLMGPNLNAMEEMAGKVGIDVIASGGVGRVQDIVNLKNTGVQGVVVGKALYTNNVSLPEAIKAAKHEVRSANHNSGTRNQRGR